MSASAIGSAQYWEEVATSRWGRYISAAETTAVEHALATAPHPHRALDVGCGHGRWTTLMLQRGWSVTASDVDPDAVRMCAERNPEADCLVVSAGSRLLSAGDASVSLVVCIEVLPVMTSEWFLPEVRRVLAPGGLLVAITWNRDSLRGQVSSALSRIRHGEPHPHYQMSYRAWRRQLVAAGMGIESEVGLCWLPFGRRSDSRLIPAAVGLERRLGLSRLPAVSPWVLVTARREGATPTSDRPG
ncbi:class I SAM-dependent methyltransferase [Geodermatophilus sp. YIM 151500]|uniref:class I SAM-dependent methyltransferase n=1 Tax=Geodermatophilus sp. YIM 151500 TaxID=2984531 RepID=UPI0021E3CDF7|nr:class I SAM-dependent methyltransferase [Geodermatophilus sp. YIM 151500]MCV2490659.1 class I SAM-dependent methyltransferase [Geodermatophilus sp. YIM 151500]